MWLIPYLLRIPWPWSFCTFVLLVEVITIHLCFKVNFHFIFIQVTSVGSSLYDDDYTTGYLPPTWPGLSTSSLSYTKLLMVIIILHCIYCHYDTCDFDSVPTTYFIGSNINVIQWYNYNDNNLSPSRLMFHLLLVSSHIDRNDPCDDLLSPSPSLCAKCNLLLQHQQSCSFCPSVLLATTITLN